MNHATSIINKLNELGYTTIDSKWYDRVADWEIWYKGNVEDFHNFRVYNGVEYVDCKLFSLGMGKKVPEDWANLLMNERVKITLENEASQEFIDGVFQKNNFEVNMNELQERGAALGCYAIVPRGRRINTDANGFVVAQSDAEIEMDFLTAKNIFPLSWVGRQITECAFSTTVKGRVNTYLYLQIHHIVNGKYDIENRAFRSWGNSGSMGDEVPLTEVPGLENVPPVLHTDSEKPLFVVGRLNISNNIGHDNNPMGIPAFANAIDELKAVDIVYDAYVNEYKLGKKRIMVQSQLTRIDVDGKGDKRQVFDSRDAVFYVLPEDVADNTLIQSIDMALRSADLSKGVQDMLNMLSFKCGLGADYYKFENGVAVTATEIIYNNQPLHESTNKHKLVLKALLEELCRILLHLGNLYMGMNLDEETPITVDLDDSVFVNKEAQLESMRLDVASGLLRPEIYLARKYSVTEEEARGMMPSMTDMVDEKQNEVE